MLARVRFGQALAGAYYALLWRENHLLACKRSALPRLCFGMRINIARSVVAACNFIKPNFSS